jgi:hypothetical protein
VLLSLLWLALGYVLLQRGESVEQPACVGQSTTSGYVPRGGSCLTIKSEWCYFENAKNPKLTFRALLTDGSREVRFEHVISQNRALLLFRGYPTLYEAQ